MEAPDSLSPSQEPRRWRLRIMLRECALAVRFSSSAPAFRDQLVCLLRLNYGKRFGTARKEWRVAPRSSKKTSMRT